MRHNVQSRLAGRLGLASLLGFCVIGFVGQAKADALHEQSVRLQVQVDGAQDQLNDAKKVLDAAKNVVAAAKKELLDGASAVCGRRKAAGEVAACPGENPTKDRDVFLKDVEDPEKQVPIPDERKPDLILGLCGEAPKAAAPPAPPSVWPDGCEKRVTQLLEVRKQLVSANDDFKLKKTALDLRQAALNASLAQQSAVTELTPGGDLAGRLRGVRKVRCMTAYCWGGADGSQYAVEPIVDLPIGLSWAVGNGGLANYINANRIDVSVTAGIRVWFAYDIASIGVLIARPSLTNTTRIYTEYSDKTFTSNSVTRPYPTLVLGLWGDILSITASYDQLRNTDGSNPVDTRFLPNEVLSRAFVFGISFNTITAARNAIGSSLAGGKP